MSKAIAIKSAAVLLVVALLSFAVWDGAEPSIPPPQQQRILAITYQTSANRTTNVNKYCPANVDRTTLAPADDATTAQTNMNGVRSQLGLDG
jgi:hypothetical protein